jgi:hypothetical protein
MEPWKNRRRVECGQNEVLVNESFEMEWKLEGVWGKRKSWGIWEEFESTTVKLNGTS